MAIQALMVILAVLLTLLFLGVPISYAIAVSSLTAILSSIDLNVAVLTAAQRTFVGMSKFSLTAIPFFILAGNIMNQGGIAKRLVDFVMSILGKLPGALLITQHRHQRAVRCHLRFRFRRRCRRRLHDPRRCRGAGL